MVLLAAAISTKAGKPLVSRQFVEMSRSRVEGLLAAFPKLLSSAEKAAGGGSRQHTFLETESVRYVYQPLDQLYVLLITTKASNILEDLETLRLFSRVIPEYCRTCEEREIVDEAFQLVFAFDEIVALGYRENVNLAQIRTFTEMDSHEERLFHQIKKTQEEEAKKVAKDKARELNRQRAEALKRGGGPSRAAATGLGPQSAKNEPSVVSVETTAEISKPKPAPTRPSGPNKAMKLGMKKIDEDQFITQLKSEGQDVVSVSKSKTTAPIAAPSKIQLEDVHVRVEEKISAVISRDGGLESMEVFGLVALRVGSESCNTVKIKMETSADVEKMGVLLTTHPNMDKKIWQADRILALKSLTKPFPHNNTDVGVLKWKFTTADENFLPFTINCWPSESGRECEVNIEYTLEKEDMVLNDVVINIPLPSSVSPVVSSCEGDYHYERAKNQLQWRLPLVDGSNRTGSLEFTTTLGQPDNFFPINVSFVSKSQFCKIKPLSILTYKDEKPVNFSQEITLYTEKYQIV